MKNQAFHQDFSATLFQRVDDFLKQPGRIQKGEWILYGKGIIILLLYFWTYFQLLAAHDFGSFFGFSILIGVCHVLIPVNIVHDATHGAFSHDHRINRLALLTMHLVGSNPFLYQKMHLKSHSDKESGSRRKAIETQQLLMKKSDNQNLPVIFYLFYAFYMAFIRDFLLIRKEKKSMSLWEWLSFTFPKAIYFSAIWIVPFLIIRLPAWQIIIGIFSIYLVITLLLIIILLMPTDPIETSKQGKGRQINDAWLREVLSHNVDFSPKSQTLNFIAGGANMNVVHYLFPQISHIHYVGLSRIIQETANEYDITYRRQSVWKVFGIHWRYMVELGRSN